MSSVDLILGKVYKKQYWIKREKKYSKSYWNELQLNEDLKYISRSAAI